ncbi:Hypothetical protein R9X50_00607400 [Acrodontium crateriforme]|uniref:Uncharacterized protein n=1 Tax=Acrodontium crateriforme TaxID=150365 RepID=A0AAQ3M9C3_9PEZI|nr:Hypothetical protein R9X50_00607400 [Acrodontium crateriforme]
MSPSPILALPTELLAAILEFVFDDNLPLTGLTSSATGSLIDTTYIASHHLQPLLVCSIFHRIAHISAFRKTTFTCTNLYTQIPDRLTQVLKPEQVSAIRHLSFVSDQRHFRRFLDWGNAPFGVDGLRLKKLTIVLQRSSFWHYLFDFTADLVRLLRRLKGVDELIFVQNAALVKGSFKAWYNRLVGLILKIDHAERYDRISPNLDYTWWNWHFDEQGQSFSLKACPSKSFIDEESYLSTVLPLLEALRESVDNEAWNPDPRTRNGA